MEDEGCERGSRNDEWICGLYPWEYYGFKHTLGQDGSHKSLMRARSYEEEDGIAMQNAQEQHNADGSRTDDHGSGGNGGSDGDGGGGGGGGGGSGGGGWFPVWLAD
ncbi:glycine-rich RNA-binding protein blt801-like [Pogonomyrmex barbatus]|uniref:Glycine-rich RNA-binding protein blt801-like n=1 Tax=Pogonomyrmex barbatus TaxID=144034 RepID=A0A6I9VSU0_9HYME|nr:glycine-rich RNA-binding protein blt801-like [Pogonomyrmex barbatus]